MDVNVNEIAKGKPLTKNETEALLALIENSKIIISKTTNATNNKLKNEEWIRLTEKFNATATNHPRTPQQLRLKWENMKKNSRKRSTRIRMNLIKTGGGPSEYIPPDGILDRVTALLDSTVSGVSVSFCGDKEPDTINHNDKATVSLPDLNEGPMTSTKVDSSIIVTECQDKVINSRTNNASKRLTFSTPRTLKKKKPDEGRSARNRALAEYFTSKKQYIDAKMNNVYLENENFKLKNYNLNLKNEKLLIETEKLKLELSKLKNE